MRARARRFAFAALAAALAAALVWWWRRPDAATAATPSPPPAPHAAASADGWEVIGEAPLPGGEGFRPPAEVVSASKLRRVLDDYKRKAQYPPDARPHDEGTWAYKRDWNAAPVVELPMNDPGDPGAALSYRFHADRAHVAYGEALTTWIEVYRAGRPAERVPFRVASAALVILGGPRSGRVVDLVYRDDGAGGDERAGDLVFSHRLVPTELDALAKAHRVQIQATIETPDGGRRLAVRDFTYAPRATLELLGVTHAVEGGSLVFTLRLRCFEAGHYTFETNLVAGATPGRDDDPVGFTRQHQALAVGEQTVAVRYFGKIFHDVGAPGPYTLRDVRGFLRLVDADEGQNLWWSDPRTWTTEAYALDAFSPAEWDSPDKRAHLEGLERDLAEAEAAEAARRSP